MTKAEIIQGLKKAMTICDSVYAYDMDKYIAEAIKALEQESTDKNFTKADIDAIVKAINDGWELRVNEILDKIRAEIERKAHSGQWSDATMYGMLKAVAIIDKYKADREALADIYKPKLKADLCIMDEFAFMPKAETEAEDGNVD